MKNLTIENKLLTGTLLVTIALISQPVLADSAWIDKKQDNQKHKIFQGVKSGELTVKETWRLGQHQKNIYQKERRFKADGNFTRRERAKVHLDLAKASGNIYKQKHDDQQQAKGTLGIKSTGINKRENHQAKRIGQGIHSGELTWGETARLGKQQINVHRQERRLKSDGTFTKRERARVQKNQNSASRSIYRAKHN